LKVGLELGVFRLKLSNRGLEPIAFLFQGILHFIAVKSLLIPQIPMPFKAHALRDPEACDDIAPICLPDCAAWHL
jgi:hypothetical protein